MKYIKYMFAFLLLMACSESNESNEIEEDLIQESILASSLEVYTENRIIEEGAVIAYAGSTEDLNAILAYFFVEDGGTDLRFFETESIEVANDDFSNYTQIDIESVPFFNGALGVFERTLEAEKWIIITYDFEDEIKISNPIKTKQNSKPTVYQQSVEVNQTTSTMPIFSWPDNAFDENAIYFQIVADNQNNLISGTYTFDSNFQYYNTSNVVLNITEGTPEELIVGENYNFTVMDVSEDNWINLIILKQNFIAE